MQLEYVDTKNSGICEDELWRSIRWAYAALKWKEHQHLQSGLIFIRWFLQLPRGRQIWQLVMPVWPQRDSLTFTLFHKYISMLFVTIWHMLNPHQLLTTAHSPAENRETSSLKQWNSLHLGLHRQTAVLLYLSHSCQVSQVLQYVLQCVNPQAAEWSVSHQLINDKVIGGMPQWYINLQPLLN